MTITRADIQLKAVFIAYKAYELIRNNDCFNVYDIYIRVAVYR